MTPYLLDKRHQEKYISCVREHFGDFCRKSHENVIMFYFFFVELLCVHRFCLLVAKSSKIYIYFFFN